MSSQVVALPPGYAKSALGELRVPELVESDVGLTIDSRLKLDELYSGWLADDATGELMARVLDAMREGGSLVATPVKAKGEKPMTTPPRGPRSPRAFGGLAASPRARTASGASADLNARFAAAGASDARAQAKVQIPQFYFPAGRPPPPEVTASESDAIAAAFAGPTRKLDVAAFAELAQAFAFSKYMAPLLFAKIDKGGSGTVKAAAVRKYWEAELAQVDGDVRMFRLLAQPGADVLTRPDFRPWLEIVVASHPGLDFLRGSNEFQARYAQFVLARIYYNVNRSWTGSITLREFLASDLPAAIRALDDEPDINKHLRYFSYEHFYITYIAYWELDTDHDLCISKTDLARHESHALTYRILDRVFALLEANGAPPDTMTFDDFVVFYMAEQDKSAAAAIEYWFRAVDGDGDGKISLFEMDFLFQEQVYRMSCLNLEEVAFNDLLCQLLDMVKPAHPTYVTLADLKRCGQAPIFFNALFNLNKFINHEQKDPATIRAEHGEPHLTPWDRFAREEYERLSIEDDDYATSGDDGTVDWRYD